MICAPAPKLSKEKGYDIERVYMISYEHICIDILGKTHHLSTRMALTSAYGSISGCEVLIWIQKVLLRWDHPTLRSVLPGRAVY